MYIRDKFLVYIELLLLSFSFFGTIILTTHTAKSITPFFTLIARTSSGVYRSDYLNLLQQHLARIGINVKVEIKDWPTSGELPDRNYDIFYAALSGGGKNPDFTGVYDENGSLNIFGYDETMDWNASLSLGDRIGWGINEWYMKKGTLIMPPNSEERIQHYWAWEQYLMDKILPCQPTFAPKAYVALWENLNGYNYSDGILQSWGKMCFDGSHFGQENNSLVVIADAAWSDLNPLFQDDSSSAFISEACLDSLVFYDQDLSVWPHVAKWYKMENDTTFVVNVRQGIKWQSDLEGNFTDEYLDIRDVYFTFYSWATISNDAGLYEWIDAMEIVNETCMKIYIDGDPSTYENEPYALFLPSASVNILPEHYLNQTQLPDGKTPDVTHKSWDTFATHCFGTSIFEFDSYIKGVETTLTVFEDCWMLNSTITADPKLNFKNRFGNFTSGLNQLCIRVIPDLPTQISLFEAGKIDLVTISSYPNKRSQYMTDPTKKIQSQIQSYMGFFGYNLREKREIIGNRDPCKKDPTISKGLAIRKAISHAIDREEINNVVHQGEFLIINHPIYLKMGIWCNPNIIQYNHNISLAKEYMELAGYEYPSTTTFSSLPTILIDFSLLSIVLLLSSIIVIYKIYQTKKEK